MLFFKRRPFNKNQKSAKERQVATETPESEEYKKKASVPAVVLSCLLVAGAIAAGIAQNNASITALAAKDSGKGGTAIATRTHIFDNKA